MAEAAQIPAAPPYTATVANGAQFAQDLGVVYAATGVPFDQVPSGPAAGQYTLGAGGTYTFAAADKGVKVLIDYLYNSDGTGGTIAIANQPMGLAPTFQAVLTGVTDSRTMTLVLNSCIGFEVVHPHQERGSRHRRIRLLGAGGPERQRGHADRDRA